MRRAKRRLVLSTGEWRWFYGRGNGITIWSPSGRKHVTNAREVTGRSWSDIERGHWKRTPDGTVSPSHIRAYIERAKLPA